MDIEEVNGNKANMQRFMGNCLFDLYQELGEDFFDTIPMGMVVSGPTGHILHANRTYCTFLGYSDREENFYS
jgi:PAS domain-containing protein